MSRASRHFVAKYSDFLTRVPLAWAPAVAHSSGALLWALVPGGGALSNVAIGPGPVSSKSSLSSRIETG